jgi:copper homeostasis protein
MPALFESCVESEAAALASAAGGADRLELCADLQVGGVTPAPALVERCAAVCRIPMFVMVRPRAGGFVYGLQEARVMERDIRAVIAAGARGIVLGALDARGGIDIPLMRRLVDIARPLPVTCHKAFDDARDPAEALDALLAIGVDRVLTSGGRRTAVEGAGAIAALVRRAGDALVVVAGGGVRAHNVAALVRRTGVREVHARLLPAGPQAPGTAEAWRATVAGFVNAARDPGAE